MPVSATTLQLLLDNVADKAALVAIVAAIDSDMSQAKSADNPPKSADDGATVRRQSADAAPVDTAAERRRERDRVRQAARRAKERAETEARKATESADVHGQSADRPQTEPPPTSSPSFSPTPPITTPYSTPSDGELSLPVVDAQPAAEFDLEPPSGLKREKPQGEIADAFAIWNETAAEFGLPKAQVLTGARKANLTARLKDCGGIDGWRDAMGKIRDAPHLLGENDRGWRADLDFVLRKDKFIKLMEGGYGRHSRPKNGAAGVDHADLANWVREREENPRYDEHDQ